VTTLVGRSGELLRLDSVIDSLGQSGAPAVVDIAGEPGIGKSLSAIYRKGGLPSRSALANLMTRTTFDLRA
jgi:hypothetical protein